MAAITARAIRRQITKIGKKDTSLDKAENRFASLMFISSGK